MDKYSIQTYSTKEYNFVENNPEDVDIVDIANSLGQIPRFNGHLQRPVSVGQHSVTLAAAIMKDKDDKELAFQGLMHDAHEAYTNDITLPFKNYLRDVHDIPWDKIVLPIKKAINEKFNIDIVDYPDILDRYDDACLRTEAECYFERPIDNWTKRINYKLESKIENVLSAYEAKKLFLATYENLTQEN